MRYLILALAGLLLFGCRPQRAGNASGFRPHDSTASLREAVLFGDLDLNTPPAGVYDAFNRFCITHFNPHQDTLYQKQAKKTEKNHAPMWQYCSERSAVLSWESALPVYSYIEYGETRKYGHKTDVQERPFYLHVHYLRDLQPDTEYRYQIVHLDENRTETRRSTGVFRTRAQSPGTIYLSSENGEPPFILDKENATYLLTEDLTANRTAFDIRAEGITLDLGGHTVTHANTLINDLQYRDLHKSGTGIRYYADLPASGLKIYNGIIKQGEAPNNSDYVAGENMLKPDPERMKKLSKNLNRGFSNIEIQGVENVEIAGITSEYHLPQTYGMRFDSCSGKYNIHHNVFLDKGVQIFDRHGAGGARSLSFQPLSHLKKAPNQYAVHHNLIKRTRQNAVNVAAEIHHNEIYVDSWVVNSFAIQPANQGGRVYDNKMFLTGYYACGVLWAEKDLLVKDNFIRMEGIKTMISKPLKGRRLIETWGEQDILAGMRITNYGKGGTYRENLRYEGNIIIGTARFGSEMRGTEFFSDYSNHGIVFSHNTIRVNAHDTLSKASCINTQGAYNDRSKHIPIVYNHNTLISNHCNIRFGDDYGQGSNHQFMNCTIIKTDQNPAYHTFVFDGKNASFGHVLRDCSFKNGASPKDVYWYNTEAASNYAIQHTLRLKAAPGARVSLTDQKGNRILSDTLLPDGVLSVPLTKFIVRPASWSAGKETEPISRQDQYQEEVLTPYTIKWVSAGREVKLSTGLDSPAELKLK